MIYLPATAQEMLLRGVDALSAPGSQIGIEEGEPIPDEIFQLLKSTEAADESEDFAFFQLIYYERFELADVWFGANGWDAIRTPLVDLLLEQGRELPQAGSQSESMVRSNTLVKALKR
jgi:O-methyltransferase involved in polyketide biosynthesis